MFKELLKNTKFRFGLIIGLFVVTFLIVLPKTPIVIKNDYVNIDTTIGGYTINLFNGNVFLDFSDFKKGLDLEGGIRIVLGTDMTSIPEQERENALEAAKSVIERRVNFLGVSEAYVAPVRVGEEYRILVEIPGVADISSAVSLIGQTAQLQFKQLKPDVEWSEENFSEYFSNPEVWEETGVSGADLLGADVLIGSGNSLDPAAQTTPQIQLRFSNEGRQKFEEVAKNNTNKPVGLFLDDSQFPLSMPVVSEDLAEGLLSDPVISGNFTLESAKALSIQIRAGALPVPVEILEQETIGATLGDAAVRQSFIAGIVGLVALLLFMIVAYGKLGLIADFSLILYTLIVLSIFKLIPVVLTLPGIAGFLLSIGVAVDANILIFERYLEELRAGRPKSLALKLGFNNAWSSIRDSNISSLITAIILFYLGSGSIRGFALTLIIGIFVSLFTAIFVVRTTLDVMKFGEQERKGFAFVKNIVSRRTR